MNRILCFHIENKNLYLEQVLIDYNNVPIFFLCKDERQYYLASCVDIEEFNYILVTLSVSELSNLLHGNIPMRDILLNQDYYWEVISNEDIFSDTVTKHKIKELSYSLLPKDNVYFQVLTEEVETFIQKLDMKAARNAEYLSMIDRGIKQLESGKGQQHELIEVDDE